MSASPFRIFVVEDDPLYSRMLRYLLELNPEHEVKVFSTGQQVIDMLHENPALITLDHSLPDMHGMEVMKYIRQYNSQLPVIIISGQEDIDTAVQLLKLGAYDYLYKNAEIKEKLPNAIHHVKQKLSLSTELEILRHEISQKYEYEKIIIGKSPAIRQVFTLLDKAAKANITVSVTGETGTGKELIAKAIHYHSVRKDEPFVAVNIAAIPHDLIESELFGHEKGAFTGAVTRRTGKFEEANRGTIFLDEIAEMPLHLQAKILRVLQEREVTRIGGNNTVKLDLRVIVATHRNLAEEVKQGTFRKDLYYRLLGLSIHLPPLRERDDDVLILARHFLDTFSAENKMHRFKISSAAADKLKKYSFPGNIRELKAVIELAAVMSSSEVIQAEDIVFDTLSKSDALLAEEMSLEDYNYRIIRHYLNKYDNNVLLIAQKLDIGKSTIYRYLKEMEKKGI